jgi:hypothetical protein
MAQVAKAESRPSPMDAILVCKDSTKNVTGGLTIVYCLLIGIIKKVHSGEPSYSGLQKHREDPHAFAQDEIHNHQQHQSRSLGPVREPRSNGNDLSPFCMAQCH